MSISKKLIDINIKFFIFNRFNYKDNFDVSKLIIDLQKYIDIDERIRIFKFHKISDKLNSIIGHYIVKIWVSNLLNVDIENLSICRDFNNKPYLKLRGSITDFTGQYLPLFNISHSESCVGVAFGQYNYENQQLSQQTSSSLSLSSSFSLLSMIQNCNNSIFEEDLIYKHSIPIDKHLYQLGIDIEKINSTLFKDSSFSTNSQVTNNSNNDNDNKNKKNCVLEVSEFFLSQFIEFFTVNEYNYIKTSSNWVESFFLLWTIKEAYSKATGKGLNTNMKQIEIIPNINAKNEIPKFSFMTSSDTSRRNCISFFPRLKDISFKINGITQTTETYGIYSAICDFDCKKLDEIYMVSLFCLTGYPLSVSLPQKISTISIGAIEDFVSIREVI